jgi:hypothetical protein
MNDTVSAATVSAATALVPGGIRLTFLTADALPSSPDWGAAHIGGSVFAADAGPSLIVDFTTLSPDAHGWIQAPADQGGGVDTIPVTVSGYAASIPDDPGPGIVGALSS